MYTCASATVPHNPLLPGELLFKGFLLQVRAQQRKILKQATHTGLKKNKGERE